MGIGAKLLGEAGATAARGLLDGLGDFGDHIRSWITGEANPETKAKLEEAWMQIQSLLAQGQNAVNLAEAQSPRLFVAGWRPFIGWACGFAIVWNMILLPLIAYSIQVVLIVHPPSAEILNALPPLPAIPLSGLYPVLLGMLGLGGMRSWEKVKDVQGNH